MQKIPFSQRMIGAIIAIIVAVVAGLVLQWLSGPPATAQNLQQNNGNCNLIVTGNVRDINCPPSQQDQILSEQQRWKARKDLEEEKIKYRNANGGCELGTHRVCWTANASRTGELLSNLGCHCESN